MITKEEAKCIADGMAEMALNAIERKAKEQMGDAPIPKDLAGIGEPLVVFTDTTEEAYRVKIKADSVRKPSIGV